MSVVRFRPRPQKSAQRSRLGVFWASQPSCCGRFSLQCCVVQLVARYPVMSAARRTAEAATPATGDRARAVRHRIAGTARMQHHHEFTPAALRVFLQPEAGSLGGRGRVVICSNCLVNSRARVMGRSSAPPGHVPDRQCGGCLQHNDAAGSGAATSPSLAFCTAGGKKTSKHKARSPPPASRRPQRSTQR